MLRENLQILFSLSILFISTNSLHLNNRGGGGGISSIGISNNIVGRSTSNNDDITDDTQSYRRSQLISSTSNLDYIDPRLNNRILMGEHYKKLPIGLGGGSSGSGPGDNDGIPTHKLFDDNFMKFDNIKSTNSSSSTPSRHYSFGYIRNLDNVIPDIDDDIDILDDNDYINNNHHRPILIGLNQQQHFHPPKYNHKYGNIPMFIGDNNDMLLRNNEFAPLTHFNRKPPSLSLQSASSILHSASPSLPTYAMINGNRNRYEHDNYGYKYDDKITKKYSNIKNNDDLIDINNNNNDNDDGMINDEAYDYRKRRINKKNKNNNQTPPKALQELFQQNGDSSISSSSSSSSNSDSGKSGNSVNSRQAPLDIRIQSKQQQQTKMRQDSQEKQQQRQTKKQLKQNENKQKKLLQMEQLKQIKRSGGSGGTPPQMMPQNPHSIASQLMLRTARGQRQYDVPQIECPSAMDGMERFACPTPDRQGRYRCIDDHVLCDGFIDCPEGEDEDRSSCMFYKTTKAHLDVLADALLRWARGR